MPLETREARESRIIPDPLHAEVKVQVQLPPEATTLLQDLHSDRNAIGLGSALMVICTLIMTWKALFGSRGKTAG